MSNAVSTRVPKYRRHKAKGLAVVTLGGRDHYLGKYGSDESREAYRRLIAEWMLGGGKHLVDPVAVSVAEVLVAYLKFAEVYYVKNGKPTNEMPMLKRALSVVRQLYARTPAVTEHS